MSMWETIGTGLKLLSAVFGFYVTGKTTKDEMQKASDAFTQARGRFNEAADDRQDSLEQQERIKAMREADEIADAEAKKQEAAMKEPTTPS